MAKHKSYRIFIYAFARGLSGILYILPRAWLLSFARGLGSLAFHVVPRHREETIRNLTTAFGKEKSAQEIQRLAQNVFRNLSQTAAEVLQFPKWKNYSLDQIIDFGDAPEKYRSLLAEGKGLITITSHLGNWELLGGIPAMKGFKSKAIARRLRDPHFQNWVEHLRTSIGVDLIYRNESPKKIFQCLKNGAALGLLPDQDIAGLKGVFVDFFGKPAHTGIAPVKLALATHAPIACVFLVRLPKNHYKIIFKNVIRPKIETNAAEALQKYTALWMKDIEEVIREYPEQWGWMHNRWKTQLKTDENTPSASL